MKENQTKFPITIKQRDYIKKLSSYPSTKEADEADIASYLGKVKKTNISQLSTKEASELIQILLRRTAEYTFVCGKKSVISKKDINKYDAKGWDDACNHACPDNIDISTCDYVQEHMHELQEEEENES